MFVCVYCLECLPNETDENEINGSGGCQKQLPYVLFCKRARLNVVEIQIEKKIATALSLDFEA